MIKITANTRVKDVMSIPELKPVKNYMVSGKGLIRTIVINLKLKHLCIDLPIIDLSSVDVDSIIRGLNRLLEVSKLKYFFSQVYTEEEWKSNPNKKDVNLVYFPAKDGQVNKPFVILCPGGAYNNVFSIAEGYPVAAKLNELGYPVFVMTYRVGGSGIFPKPLDDLAKALTYIKKHKEVFNIKHFKYLLFGFSAGGNLSAVWGTDNHGYKVYGIDKPLALVLAYPVISNKLFESKKIADIFCKTMLGVSAKKAIEMDYNVDEHMSNGYPPCYIVCCEDDNVVPFVNSKRLKIRLDELDIPAILEIGFGGGHGFGEGVGTDVECWIERADEFIMKLSC